MSNSPSSRLRIVVVGGVAGGASAAARARRCNADAEITVLEKGPDVSFANCGLPYHLGGEIEDRSKLIVATAELFWDRFRIRVRTGHEVTAIDRSASTVTGKTLEGEESKMPYDRLVLATGSQPIRPDFYDAQVENVFQLWTLDDMDRIIASMKNRQASVGDPASSHGGINCSGLITKWRSASFPSMPRLLIQRSLLD